MGYGSSAPIVLWHGQYCNDGKERMETLKRQERMFFGLANPRLVGRSGHWKIVADAFLDSTHPDDVELPHDPLWAGDTRRKGASNDAL